MKNWNSNLIQFAISFTNSYFTQENQAEEKCEDNPGCVWDTFHGYIDGTIMSDKKYLQILYWMLRISIGVFCFMLSYTMLTNKKFSIHPYRLYGLELFFFSGWIFD